MESQSEFTRQVDALVKQEYEKHRLIDYIQRKKVNDFAKVRYAEQVAGVTVAV